MVFIHLIHYKVYLTALKISKLKWIVYGTYCINVLAYNLWTFTWFVHFELPFRLKGTEKIHTERFFKFLSNIYSILFDYNAIFYFKNYDLSTETKCMWSPEAPSKLWFCWKPCFFGPTGNKGTYRHNRDIYLIKGPTASRLFWTHKDFLLTGSVLLVKGPTVNRFFFWMKGNNNKEKS